MPHQSTAEQALAKALQQGGTTIANTDDGCRSKDPANCPTHGTGNAAPRKKQSGVKTSLNKAKDSVSQAVTGNAKYKNLKNSMEAGIHRDFIGKMGKNMDISTSNLHRDCGLSKDASKKLFCAVASHIGECFAGAYTSYPEAVRQGSKNKRKNSGISSPR